MYPTLNCKRFGHPVSILFYDARKAPLFNWMQVSHNKLSDAGSAPRTVPKEGRQLVAVELKALVVSSDSEHGRILATILGACGLEAQVCSTLDGARGLLANEAIRLGFCEAVLPDGSFRDVLQAIADSGTAFSLVVFSGAYDWNLHFEAARLGALTYIVPPFRAGEIERIAEKALLDNARRQAGKVAPGKGDLAIRAGSINHLRKATVP